MHHLIPYQGWRMYYDAYEDPHSPFFHKYPHQYHTIYNYIIHPEWDDIGSDTLYVKLLYADYQRGRAVIELIGEWNDCITNDIHYLKREVIDPLLQHGVRRFVLIGENVLNYHYEEPYYFEKWHEELGDGWIIALNFQLHVLREFQEYGINRFFQFGGEFNNFPWRTLHPDDLFEQLEGMRHQQLHAIPFKRF